MRDVKSALSKTLNALTGKRGPLWAWRYDAEPCVDDHGGYERAGYLVDNPRKARLVDDPEHWPGLLLAYGLCDEDSPAFEYLDRTAWHRKKRPQGLSPFFRTATLALSPLPGCEGMPREVYLQSLRSWVEHARAKSEASEGDHGRRRPGGVLGVEGVIGAAFDARPKSPKFSRRPYVFGKREACDAYTKRTVALGQAHAQASECFRLGQREVRFPPGTYPPPLMQAA